jgi:hypothetical protein
MTQQPAELIRRSCLQIFRLHEILFLGLVSNASFVEIPRLSCFGIDSGAPDLAARTSLLPCRFFLTGSASDHFRYAYTARELNYVRCNNRSRRDHDVGGREIRPKRSRDGEAAQLTKNESFHLQNPCSMLGGLLRHLLSASPSCGPFLCHLKAAHQLHGV